MFMLLWYNGSSKKSTPGRSLRLARGGRKYGVWITTTILTIYGFGLRGNSAYKSTRKHCFRTQKPPKALQSKEKIGIFAFGSRMPQVRVLSLRPPAVPAPNYRVSSLLLFYLSHDGEILDRHSHHMKIIRTFSYLENRSDYLFYLSTLFFCELLLIAMRIYSII